MTTLEQFHSWLKNDEDEHLEFKEAKNNFDFNMLLEYCVALANEGGGKLVLGVSDKKPRRIVGTSAISNIQKMQENLYEKLQLRVEIEKFLKDDKRILIIHVPSRPVGQALHLDGKYLMRIGERLLPMDSAKLKEILNETETDFSAQMCHRATINDLLPEAIQKFRTLWAKKSNKKEILNLSDKQLLKDAELFDGKYLNYAALILLGKRESLGEFLPDAETIFEYRNNASNIEYQDRKDYRIGYLFYCDELWEKINARNEMFHIQEGLFMRDILAFNEEVIREAILNAVCHRDYHLHGSVFIKQYPQKFIIESPGGFPNGVTEENILTKHVPRNRRIAEAFEKIGFVERSGQGARKMFKFNIIEGKGRPDYSKTDNYCVRLALSGTVQDVEFLRYLEKIGKEYQKMFDAEDLLLLDDIRQGRKITSKKHINKFKEMGLIESCGVTRGTRHLLSKKYYSYVNKGGEYTRKRGLDKDTNKMLIIEHLKHFTKGKITDFEAVFPGMKRQQIHRLLHSLKKEGKIEFRGSQKSGFWIFAEMRQKNATENNK
ncbi:MAG: putative DNA binding domain-containing protein [Candidatus Schekmanbacteria bacterium]|nr:putative DNA binding domain-containing protein [Candidatus Schekmanbacteria bacterium]